MTEFGAGPGPGRRAVLAGLLLAGTGLAGCARIPTSGPVSTHSAAGDRPVDRPFPILPRQGSTPAEIVEGFLSAAAIGQARDFFVARAYFSDRDLTWSPDAEVVIYTSRELVVVSGPGARDDEPGARPPGASRSGAPAAARSGASASTASGPSPGPASRTQAPSPQDHAEVVVRLKGVVATVDRNGRLSLAGDAQERRRTFSLVVDSTGEWRIDDLDPGLAMTTGQWAYGSYPATPLYYPDPTGRWLVPDLRYVRREQNSTPALVVSALLSGPVPWLSPAVTQPRPWPQLKVSSVPVTGSVATVDLKRSTLGLDESVQSVLKVQLRESLRAATPVTEVQMTVDGQPLQGATPAAGDPARPARAEPRLAALAATGSTFVAVDAKARIVVGDVTSLRPVPGVQLTGGARPAMSYTEAGAGRTFALVVSGRTPTVRTLKVAEGAGPPLDVTSADDLVTPSFDPSGWVWTAPRRPAGAVVAGIVLSGTVRTVTVPAPWLTDGQLVALRVSREGARAVLAVDDVGSDGRRRTRVLLAGVVRDRTGVPLRLTGPAPLLPDVARATDVAWLDDRRVVVLGSRVRDDRRLVVQPWLVDVGGDPTDQGVVPTADLGQIVTGADSKPLTSVEAWERLTPDLVPTLAVGDGLGALYVAGPRGDLFGYRPTGSWAGHRVSAFRPAFPG